MQQHPPHPQPDHDRPVPPPYPPDQAPHPPAEEPEESEDLECDQDRLSGTHPNQPRAASPRMRPTSRLVSLRRIAKRSPPH
jgi:hypothetical protein